MLERPFKVALLFSVITHGVIFLQNPRLAFLSNARQSPPVEIRYIKNPEELKKDQTQRPLMREPILKTTIKITSDKKTPPPFVDRDKLFSKTRAVNSRQGLFTKPALSKPDIIAIKKKISLPPVDLDKINNPSYIGYYQIVREKIRRAAYQNYVRTETGEVYLSFVVSYSGEVKDVRLVDEKSSPSQYLRDIALGSLKDAAPFPKFPSELDYPQLSFNVVISFEVE